MVNLAISGSPSLWSYTTDPQTDKASHAEWLINSSLEIPADSLNNRNLVLTVKDHKAKNKTIGSGTISLRSLVTKGGQWSEYEGYLFAPEKEKQCGEYRVRMRYRYKIVTGLKKDSLSIRGGF